MASKRKSILKFAIPALLIIALVIVVMVKQKSNKTGLQDGNSGSDDQTQTVSIKPNADQYNNKLIASSDNYELYLDGSTLSVTIKDKKTGAILESSVKQDDGKSNAQWLGFMKSGIVINAINGLNDTEQVDLVNNTSQIMIENIDNGVHAYVSFPDMGFSFEETITLDGDNLVVDIPDQFIVESMPGKYIGAINVLPFLGYSYLGEKPGYMFIPDGNGALIYLNDKEGRLSGGYSEMIYGEDVGFKDSETVSLLWDQLQTVNDTENVMAPIFGMVHTDDQIGYLGIVESGAQRASIEAYPNGVMIDYNRIYPKFLMRKLYKQPTSESDSGTIAQVEKDRTHYDIKVRYSLVNGDKANYTGLAVTYRDYLLNNGLTAKDTNYKTRIDFLGTDREDWLIFKKKVTMTTVKDIRNIYSDLAGDGVTNILSLYKGWQSGGLYQVPITDYKADSAIGGTKELTKLIKDTKAAGNQFYLYQDALRINPDENNTTFNVVKRVDKRLFEEFTYMDVYNRFLYLIPSRTDYIMNRISADYEKKGVTGISLAGITNNLFSYSYGGKYYSRPDTMQQYIDTVSGMDPNFDLALEQPFSYLWQYTDAFLDMPVGTSNFNFIDEEIPFLSIALKGIIPMYSEYMNFEANKQKFFLQLVEMGIYPSFYITKEDSSKLIYTNSADIYSSRYDIYKSEIETYAKELKSVNDAVQGALIIGHEHMDNGVTKVSYDNGVTIYINYSDNDQPVDGYTIGAMSYKVGGANE
ncbi:MAG TPA: DUF5696 domain-containing protein [Mobilitalea sp.]|nr:DUF5696 domain-containing protein [Mobilitalea sp.]